VRCPDCVGGVGIVEVDLYAGTGVAASFSALLGYIGVDLIEVVVTDVELHVGKLVCEFAAKSYVVSGFELTVVAPTVISMWISG
jgi:hypothetical protein